MTSGVAVTAKWQAIPGRLIRISKGRSGVWGVNRGGNIYKLNSNGIELRPQGEGGSEVDFQILRYVVELDLNFHMLQLS